MKRIDCAHYIIRRKKYDEGGRAIIYDTAGVKLSAQKPGSTIRVRLFIKEKGMEFTSEGEHLVDYSKEMLQEFRRVKDDMLNMSHEVSGVLRLESAILLSISSRRF